MAVSGGHILEGSEIVKVNALELACNEIHVRQGCLFERRSLKVAIMEIQPRKMAVFQGIGRKCSALDGASARFGNL